MRRLNKRLSTNFWDRIANMPPWLVRLCAKKQGRDMPLAEQAMSDEEIATACGTTALTVRMISRAPSWEGVDIMMVRDFMRACRCDPATEEIYRVRDYLFGRREPRFKYLKFSPHWESTFKPLFELYLRQKR